MELFDQLREQLGEFGQDLSEDVVMKDKVKLSLAGIARYYFRAMTVPALTKAIGAVNHLKMPWVILGGGNRIIFSETGFDGLIIHNLTNNLTLVSGQSQIIAESGVLVPRLVMEAISHDLGGLEFFVQIEGTVGGALWFNAEQFGLPMSQYIKRITICFPDGTVESHPVSWFRFDHHDHRFFNTHEPHHVAFLSVLFQVHTAKKYELMRKIQFFKSRIPAVKPPSILVCPLFHLRGSRSQGNTDELLQRIISKELQKPYARLVPKILNGAEIRPCKSQQLRDWLEAIKLRAYSTTGVRLEELFSYVGQ